MTVVSKPDRFQISYGGRKSSGHFFMEEDYGVTRDFLLFGVVNSTDGTFPAGESPLDKPFRFRFRVDDALTIKQMNMGDCTLTGSKIEGQYPLQKK